MVEEQQAKETIVSVKKIVPQEKLNPVQELRVGRFVIDHHIIRNELEFMTMLMKKIIVVRAESMYAQNAIEYVGYSELFEPVPPGNVVPSYLITYKEGKKGKGCILAEKL